MVGCVQSSSLTVPARAFVCEIGQPVGGDRRRIQEHHRPAVRLALLLRELEQVERALDVDLVGGDAA